MRNLTEIIEAVQSNERPDYEELRYALLALNSISNRAMMDRRELLFENISPIKINFMQNDLFYSQAFSSQPKDWLGWSKDPENPDYQRQHKIFLNLWSKVMNGGLPNQKGKDPESFMPGTEMK